MSVFTLFRHSAVISHIQHLKLNSICLSAVLVDLLLGVVLWNFLNGLDLLPLLNQFSQLTSHMDNVISWLTSNPVGLKLNGPVNTALASFFTYHIYLWKTFVQFIYAPIILQGVLYSTLAGFSCAAAVCTDLIAVFTLHIHCFDVYASSLYVKSNTARYIWILL